MEWEPVRMKKFAICFSIGGLHKHMREKMSITTTSSSSTSERLCGAWEMAELVDFLPLKCEALNSIPGIYLKKPVRQLVTGLASLILV